MNATFGSDARLQASSDAPSDMPQDWLHEEPRAGVAAIGLRNLPQTKAAQKGPVLLVHGASAGSRTFLYPGADQNSGLAGYLREAGWDVWLLDWRSSNLLVPVLIDELKLGDDYFDLDEAELDLEAAVALVKQRTGAARVPVVGHCIGGALVAQLLARGGAQDIGDVVLSTLGLFYATGLDDWLKGNEHFIEEAWWGWRAAQKRKGPASFISPWAALGASAPQFAWPPDFEKAFEAWKQTPLPHCERPFCQRACFMFGMPYRVDEGAMKAIHDGDPPQGLWRQFGRMPLGIYMHVVQNLRRGWAAPFDADDQDESSLDAAALLANRHVTMLTGRENQVWHRDSIDRMNEWLLNEAPSLRDKFTKRVFESFGHQDLLWSSRAAAPGGPYATIADALEKSRQLRHLPVARTTSAAPRA